MFVSTKSPVVSQKTLKCAPHCTSVIKGRPVFRNVAALVSCNSDAAFEPRRAGTFRWRLESCLALGLEDLVNSQTSRRERSHQSIIFPSYTNFRADGIVPAVLKMLRAQLKRLRPANDLVRRWSSVHIAVRHQGESRYRDSRNHRDATALWVRFLGEHTLGTVEISALLRRPHRDCRAASLPLPIASPAWMVAAAAGARA